MSDLTIIPDGWQKRSLISLADYVNGYSFGPSDWAEDGRLIIKIEQLNNPNAKGARFSGDISPAYHIVNGDLIFSWSATLKAEFWKGEPGVLNQHLFKVIPNSDVNMSLLQKLLEFYMDELAAGSQGSTMKHITRAELIKFQVVLPIDKDEQQKIAKILSTVDNLIEKTQTLIEKYTAIKQGMMADLFTRGIDMTTSDTPNSKGGKLRPSVEGAPELYKQTELGWVPKEWEVCQLSEELKSIEQGWSPDCEADPAITGRWGVLKTTAVVWEGYSDEANKALPVGMNPRVEYEVRSGDVLMTRAGPGNRVGVVAYVGETQEKLMLSDKLYRIVPTSKINRKYLALLLSSSSVQRQIDATKTGLAESQSNISQGIVKKLMVWIPDLEEQNAVVDRISAVDREIDIENRLLLKIGDKKKGLMQDLLTGRVCVEV